MSALNFKPPELAIAAVLGIGAFWFLTQRRAVAGTNSPARATRGFFLSPSQAGDSIGAQAATAGRNAALLSGPLGALYSKLSTLAPSVTSAIPSSMRQSEKASYDVAPDGSQLATGDFSRMDRGGVPADGLAVNGPGLSDPYDFTSEYWY